MDPTPPIAVLSGGSTSPATTPEPGRGPPLEHDAGATSAISVLSAEDGARYQSMVSLHFDAVWRTLRGLGVPAGNVDDAAQQVFLVALRRLHVVAHGSERSFLLGTAVGIAANARRGLARAKEVPDPDALFAGVDPRPDPEQAAVLSERRAIVQHVLDAMPDELRAVFVLFELEGLTSIEIGQMLAIPTGTASSRLRRAREHFQAEVGRVLARGGPERRSDQP